MGTGFAKKKKEAKRLRESFEEMQEKMKTVSVTGSAGAGLVEVTLNGEHEMTKLKINPECVDKEDVDGLQDLIKVAYKNALAKLKEETQEGLPSTPFGF